MGFDSILGAYNQIVKLLQAFFFQIQLKTEVMNILHHFLDEHIQMFSNNIFGAFPRHLIWRKEVKCKYHLFRVF